MADNLVTQDPTKPGVLKANGTPLAANGQLPLTGLDPTGASNGDVVVLAGGVWTAGSGGASADTASNLGAGSQVFKSKVGADFQFRSLVNAGGVTITQNANDISFAVSSATGSIVILADQKPSGTDGGTFTSAAWRTRDINTEVADPDGLATIAANQITLAAGTYRCQISCPCNHTNSHQARLQNITDATTLVTGTSENTGSGDSVNTRSFIIGRFTLAVAKVLEIQHQAQTTRATNGFGDNCGAAFAVAFEEYTVAIFLKE